MKRVIKILLSGAITLILIVGVIYRLGILVRPTNADSAFKAIDTFHDMPQNSLEVIGYGLNHLRLF